MSASSLGLYVEVPIASFRVPQAREYLETYSIPPPATVFGMLLSYVGEQWRQKHSGVRVAIVALNHPVVSTVLRKTHRFKEGGFPEETMTDKERKDYAQNVKPDFQDLLTDVRLAVWLKSREPEGLATDRPPVSLQERVAAALRDPPKVSRFGGLSLGESTFLVNELRALRPSEIVRGDLLRPDLEGPVTLPVWPHHVSSAGTRWGRYRLEPFEGSEPDDQAFEVMAP